MLRHTSGKRRRMMGKIFSQIQNFSLTNVSILFQNVMFRVVDQFQAPPTQNSRTIVPKRIFEGKNGQKNAKMSQKMVEISTGMAWCGM